MSDSIPTVSTARLTLRPFTLDDAPSLFRIMNEPNIMQYFPNPGPRPLERVEKTIQFQLDHWREYGLGWWAVVPHGHNDIVGWNGLQFLDETNETEVGYLLSREFWGKGYATEGALAGLEFGFHQLGKKEIIGLTHPENTASQNVLLKCGMKFTHQAPYFGMELFRYVVAREQFTKRANPSPS